MSPRRRPYSVWKDPLVWLLLVMFILIVIVSLTLMELEW